MVLIDAAARKRQRNLEDGSACKKGCQLGGLYYAVLGVKRQEFQMKKTGAFLFLLLFSLNLFANEEFCGLEYQDVKDSLREGHDGSTWIRLTFPATEMGFLYRIQLRYDHIEKMGGHEVFAELAFDEASEGYEMFVDLAEDHKPLLLVATYHLNGGACYSNLYVVIENRKISSVINDV
ncbi:MAG: hypothetical protein WC997_07920 [Porticoccaceae bacterium]